MTTMTRKPKSVKPSKAEPVASLALSIDHQVHSLSPIRSDDPDIILAWRLTRKSDAATFDLYWTVNGNRCSCPATDPAGCRHLKAALLVGIIEPVPTYDPPAWDEPAPMPCCGPAEAAPCRACLTAAPAPAIEPAHCVCPQCRTCSDAIAEHAEVWTGDPLPAAEASFRGAIMSGHEPDPDEDWGPAETWPEGPWDNWFWESDPDEDRDDQAEAALFFADNSSSCLLSEYLALPSRQSIRRGCPSAGYAGGDGERFSFGHP